MLLPRQRITQHLGPGRTTTRIVQDRIHEVESRQSHIAKKDEGREGWYGYGFTERARFRLLACNWYLGSEKQAAMSILSFLSFES